jgi:hypothetical protein
MQQRIFNRLFQNNLWDSGNILKIQEEIKAHPYFALSHYFLLKQTGIGHENYDKIAGKAALYFNNPFLLQCRLLEKDGAAEREATQVVITESIIQKPAVEEKLLTRKPMAKEEMLFEPLFASDYFASQGIKLSAEMLQNDKLGKQMKSFTEWLKTMKKTSGYKMPETAINIDASVEKMAEKSNADAEVITETMADIFIQQGKIAKAAEIYEKLSLLNPAKSPYFAAKIELLKAK